MLLRKSFCAFPDEIDVRTLAQDLACCPNRIRNVFDTAHAPGAECGAVHNQSVELHLAFAIQKAATSGIESLIVLHYDNGFFGRIKSRASFFEHCPSSGDRITDAIQMCFNHFVGNCPCAAMNKKNGTITQSK